MGRAAKETGELVRILSDLGCGKADGKSDELELWDMFL